MDNKMKKRETNILWLCLKSKRAQVTIFIIMGVLIISIAVLFFIFKSGVIPYGGGGREINPDSFLKSCMEEKIKETIKTISIQGGNMNPVFYKRFKFTDEDVFVNISYLCYNQNYYLPCINQEPMLIQHLKDEIKNEIQTEIENCFTELGKSLDEQGYTVDAVYNGFEVKLLPKKIVIEIAGELTLTKAEEPLRYENFTITLTSRLYDLTAVTYYIISQEAKPCGVVPNFDALDFMSLHPEFSIDMVLASDSVKIYIIKHQDDENKFIFALRGCVIPSGY